MSKVYVAEYAGLASTNPGDSIAVPAQPPLAEYVLDTAATTGSIRALGAITAGSLYVNGTYANVPLTGGTGAGATANITVSGAAVTAVTLVNRGTGYTAADALSASNANLGGAGSGFSIPVSSIVVRSVPFQAATTFVEFSTDGICSVAFGTDPLATTTNARFAANERSLRGGFTAGTSRVSVITNT